MRFSVRKEDIRYAIAIKGATNRFNNDFVSKLQHKFAGKDEVLAFNTLNKALCFCTKPEAEAALAAQPVWARQKCEVIAFELTGCGERYLLR